MLMCRCFKSTNKILTSGSSSSTNSRKDYYLWNIDEKEEELSDFPLLILKGINSSNTTGALCISSTENLIAAGGTFINLHMIYLYKLDNK